MHPPGMDYCESMLKYVDVLSPIHSSFIIHGHIYMAKSHTSNVTNVLLMRENERIKITFKFSDQDNVIFCLKKYGNPFA